ncbi:hypothetical protein I316_03047 [Kwoniella heveanensis BCC8398]|uniref:Uncharacterized protein n=1 Tax=Kwoniella heveanensis BCC8398 TaxID=1296120 RepID=A0A1B9GVE5_9TREE|nr:hypothetical protein I316_03047 [Kwoniella heveanensis BCC8398]
MSSTVDNRPTQSDPAAQSAGAPTPGPPTPATEHQEPAVEHKPTMGEKITGKFQELVGKTTNNESKALDGQTKTKGQVVSPSTDMDTAPTAGSNPSRPSIPALASAPSTQCHSPTEGYEYKHEHEHDLGQSHRADGSKHAGAHPRDSPHHTTTQPLDPRGDGNTNAHADLQSQAVAHKDKHSIHSADIPPPRSDSEIAAYPDYPIQGADIPLPPSHTNSFAPGVLTPLTPLSPAARGDETKSRSTTGYMAHGGMPTLHSTHVKHLAETHQAPEAGDAGSGSYTGLGRTSDTDADTGREEGEHTVHLLDKASRDKAHHNYSQVPEDRPQQQPIPHTISAHDPVEQKIMAPHEGTRSPPGYLSGDYFGLGAASVPGQDQPESHLSKGDKSDDGHTTTLEGPTEAEADFIPDSSADNQAHIHAQLRFQAQARTQEHKEPRLTPMYDPENPTKVLGFSIDMPPIECSMPPPMPDYLTNIWGHSTTSGLSNPGTGTGASASMPYTAQGDHSPLPTVGTLPDPGHDVYYGFGQGHDGGEKAGIIGIGGTMDRTGIASSPIGPITHTTRGAHHVHDCGASNEGSRPEEQEQQHGQKDEKKEQEGIKSHIPGTDEHKPKHTSEADSAAPNAPGEINPGLGPAAGGQAVTAGTDVGSSQGGVADRSFFPPGSSDVHERKPTFTAHDDADKEKLEHDHKHDDGHEHSLSQPAFTSHDITSTSTSAPTSTSTSGRHDEAGTDQHDKLQAKAKKPIAEKIAELVPGTSAHKEKKEEKALMDDAEKDV